MDIPFEVYDAMEFMIKKVVKKDILNKANNKYRQSYKGKKSRKIYEWKRRGLLSDDYDALYEKIYKTTNCEECGILLTKGRKTTSTTKCMDHDHTTGLFRNVLCHSCNTKRG